MNKPNSTPMTLTGKKMLEERLEYLIKVEREQIKNTLAEARAMGDLRENAEYHAAKERQSLNEGKIKEMQYNLSVAQVIDVSTLNGPDIKFGATVTIYDLAKEKSVTYQIVGSDEAQIKTNTTNTTSKIPFTSPLAKALIGKQQGDTVIVDAPKGKIEYEIEKVEYKEYL
ncbi:MAG: transcription elongation factor GreA [Oligoflexia bacterium]|nr:transcription elongation factor GreA [Oligoflexia bacterium]